MTIFEVCIWDVLDSFPHTSKRDMQDHEFALIGRAGGLENGSTVVRNSNNLVTLRASELLDAFRLEVEDIACLLHKAHKPGRSNKSLVGGFLVIKSIEKTLKRQEPQSIILYNKFDDV